MNFIRAARAIGGLLAIILLLAVTFLDFWLARVTVEADTVLMLLGLITGLLGVDVLSQHIIEISVQKTQNGNNDRE